MSSVFDDVAAIAKAQTEAYHTAYQTGYLQGFRDATAQAKAIIERAFPHFEKTDERCKHGVWAADHCYQCNPEYLGKNSEKPL